jgi:hypothetical protein
VSLRYRTEFSETGDVLDPQAWNVNQNELTSEFNGGLDRDNLLAPAVFEGQIVNNAFTNIRYSAGVALFTPSTALRTWQRITGSYITGDFPQDCVIICEWGGTWTWGGAYLGTFNSEECVAFRIVVDGVDIATSHYFGESTISNSTSLVGAVPLSAGTHAIWAEIFFARVRHRDLQFVDDDVTRTFDINVNEMLIEERRR